VALAPNARFMPPDEPREPYHVHTHPSGAEYWRHVIEIVAFIVAAAWAFYVFIYQERIKPAETAPQQQFNIAISHQPVPSGSEFVSVNIEVRNVGTVPFKIAGYVVAAYGYHYVPKITQTVFRSMRRNVTTLRRTLAESAPDLLQSIYATFSSFGSNQPTALILPGGNFSTHEGFGIPRNKYDAIFLKYKLCVVWADNTRVYNPHPYRDATGAYWFAYPPTNKPSSLTDHIQCRQVSRDEFAL
jgi:hypothetical protein